MPELNGSATHRNVVDAFARESQTALRYLWFAQQADVEGRPTEAAMFRSIADGEIGHAHGLLEFLAEVDDPATGGTIGDTDDNIRSAIIGESDDAARTFPQFAVVARDEGFEQIAAWFDTLARAEQSQVERLRRGADETS